MNWRGSREADARLSAREAVKVRAALAESISSQTLYEAYLATSPNSSGNIAQDRARARAWAIINVRVNMEALKLVLIRIWTTGYLLGELSADELVGQARRAQKSAMITKKETNAPQPQRAITMDIDWDSWTPGDQLTAAMLKPPKGLRRLLDASGVSIKGINNTTLNDIGNALGEAVALGLAPKQASKLIRQSVGSPARALSISITEMNRAVSAATIDRYRDFGLTQMRWVTFDPCDKCAMNDQEVANIGAPFPSGDTQTPAHPNCRCRLAPVIPGEDGASASSVNEQSVELPATTGIVESSTPPLTFSKQGAAEEARRRYTLGKQIDISDYTSNPDDRTYETDRAKMGEIIAAQGWDKPSISLSPEEFDAIVAEGPGNYGLIALYRGGPEGMGQAFIEGKPYIGDGNAGPGIYTTTRVDRAGTYAALVEKQGGKSEITRILAPADIYKSFDRSTWQGDRNPLPAPINQGTRADVLQIAAQGNHAYSSIVESTGGDFVVFDPSMLIIRRNE